MEGDIADDGSAAFGGNEEEGKFEFKTAEDATDAAFDNTGVFASNLPAGLVGTVGLPPLSSTTRSQIRLR